MATATTTAPKPGPLTRARLWAAGFGKRLRPLTQETPKPLVKVANRALIDWVLDRLVEGGVRRAVVNTHWLGERIVEHLSHTSFHGLRRDGW